MDDNKTEKEAKLRLEICDAGLQLYHRGLVVANEGNITARLSSNRFLCTPTKISKGRMQTDDLVIVDASGKVVSGTRNRSSEALVHLAIYRNRPDVHAVIHSHPPHVVAFAFTGAVIPEGVSPEVELFLGPVETVSYATPSTQALADAVGQQSRRCDALVLANHGAVCYGATIEQALWRTEILDGYCRSLILANSIGPLQFLSEDQRQEIREQRKHWL